jgi:hypothetical protein
MKAEQPEGPANRRWQAPSDAGRRAAVGYSAVVIGTTRARRVAKDRPRGRYSWCSPRSDDKAPERSADTLAAADEGRGTASGVKCPAGSSDLIDTTNSSRSAASRRMVVRYPRPRSL